MGTMIIDGRKIAFENEKNILAVIRKAGIQMPTFCYNTELSIYGACRLCVVEDERGSILASCSTPPKDGMSVKTNTEKLQKHRRMIIELLLASHCRDCTTCDKNGKCRLQEVALKLGVRKVRFGDTRDSKPIDDSAHGIIRDPNKCILCGDCVRMCSEIQGVGAIDFAHRGSKVVVMPAFNTPLGESNCVNCGQCAAVCPTGALMIKNETDKAWSLLSDKNNKRVVAQIAPAVRVALGEEFGMRAGKFALGKIIAALKRLGFDEVYDTSLAADITVIEESNELIDRLKNGGKFPMFTSCCPGWMQFVMKKYPEFLDNTSTCRSPMAMFSAILREHFEEQKKKDGVDTTIVAIMPCTAKKYEADREEFKVDGKRETELVLTTAEVAKMIKSAGICFDELEDEAPDMPFGLASGAGMIFGVTGGVTEAVIRRVNEDKGGDNLREIANSGIRGRDNLKTVKITVCGKELKVGVVYGLKEAGKLLDAIKKGEEHYDFVEVMACPEGCIAGGGQPCNRFEDREQRARGLYRVDKQQQIKSSDQNPMVDMLYEKIKGREHDLLHVHYNNEK